ncbi:MAG: hypothetical protein NTV08_14285 [Verrucomicrobia bacterium]|nr:hypothetical protein [Verrucomicrobiota bacterium]
MPHGSAKSASSTATGERFSKIENHRPLVANAITGLEVLVRVQLRLELILRRRLDELDDVFLLRLHAQRDGTRAIRRDEHGLKIPVVLRAVARKLRLLASEKALDPHVLITDESAQRGLQILDFKLWPSCSVALLLTLRLRVFARAINHRLSPTLAGLEDAEALVRLILRNPHVACECVLREALPQLDRREFFSARAISSSTSTPRCHRSC